MKRICFLFMVCMGCLTSYAQEKTAVPVLDKSPMDMSYFPDQYPLLKFQGKVTDPPYARVIYGRPQRDGRKIFGELIHYNEIWRIGANEATEVEFYRNVRIGGKAILKGRYTLFCIPTETEWTFIINKDTDTWGAFRYDAKKDLVRVKVKVKKLTEPVEPLSIYFNKTAGGANLNVAWEDVTAALPVSF
jgi:hypothetical protein